MTATLAAAAPRVMLVALLCVALSACNIFRRTERVDPTIGKRMPVLAFEQNVLAEPEIADIEVLLPPAEANAAWSQPGGSPSRAMGHLALAPTIGRQWSARIGRGSDATRRLNATPVIDGGRLFAVDTEGRVSAFDATTGRPLWQVSTFKGRGDTRPASGGGVSAMDGRLFVTSGLGFVVALSAETGQELWRHRHGTPLRGAPTVAQGRVFAMAQDSQLIALSAETGALLWEANATLEPASLLATSGPAVALETAVAGFPSGELFALRVENGRTVWQDQLARTGRTTALGALSDIAASPVIDRGRVFAIGHGGRMVAIELASGQRVWERSFAGVSTPVVAGDWVFAVTVDGELVALTRTDGRVRWVTQLPRWRSEKRRTGAILWFGPVLAGERLILVSSERQMRFVSPQDGRTLGEVRLPARAFLPPVVAGGQLFVLTDDGTVTAYR
jgi:outer membrane protein assembly factor BamB